MNPLDDREGILARIASSLDSMTPTEKEAFTLLLITVKISPDKVLNDTQAVGGDIFQQLDDFASGQLSKQSSRLVQPNWRFLI